MASFASTEGAFCLGTLSLTLGYAKPSWRVAQDATARSDGDLVSYRAQDNSTPPISHPPATVELLGNQQPATRDGVSDSR